MNIQILNAKHQNYSNLGRYFFTEMQAGKHHATVVVAPDHVQVCVHNASNRAWGGMGRRFENAEKALAGYKSPEVRAMIETAIAGAAA